MLLSLTVPFPIHRPWEITMQKDRRHKLVSFRKYEIALSPTLRALLAGKYPHVSGQILTYSPFGVLDRKRGLSVELWFPHSPEHGNRPCSNDDLTPRLSRLTVREKNLLGSIADELAGSQFTLEFLKANEGRLQYLFVPIE